MDIARVDVLLRVEYGKGVRFRHFYLFSPSIVSIGCFKHGRTIEVYLSHLAGGKLSLKSRDMPMILLSTFAIGLQFCLLSLFLMTSLSCQVFGQTGRNQWSSRWTRSDKRNQLARVVSLCWIPKKLAGILVLWWDNRLR